MSKTAKNGMEELKLKRIVSDIEALSLGTSNDGACFPRCEYRTRFQETSYFEMNEPDYWGTYFRSTSIGGNSDRYSALKLQKTYDGSKINSPRKGYRGEKPVSSYYSKTGAFYSPFARSKYQAILSKEPKPPKKLEGDNFLYDEILKYKQALCLHVIESFGNNGDLGVKVGSYNDYPCVMVRIPAFDGKGSVESWYEMAMAYFVTITNKNSKVKSVPIEIVIRSSFGHNLPSVAATGTSFRINIGLIPQKYAEILAESLVELGGVIKELDGTCVDQALISSANERIRKYNNGRDKKVDTWSSNLFDILDAKGDTQGKKVILQILRMKRYVDLLANYVTEAFQKPTDMAKPLLRMLQALDYGKTISFKEPGEDYHGQKIKFTDGQDAAISKDEEFWKLITAIAAPLGITIQSRNLHGLYALLEKGNLEFIQNSSYQYAEDGIGSDSECEAELDDKLVFSKKVTVATGMRAINLATFIALYQLKRLNVATYSIGISNMYYETAEAVELVVNPFEQLLGSQEKMPKFVKKDAESELVFFDLAHCETGGKASAELKFNAKSIVVLDYTSATTEKTSRFVKECLATTPLVILVSSGLKNEQAGADMNPYGTVRIVTKDKNLLEELYGLSKHILEGEKLPAAAHKIRKSYKDVGFVVTNGKIFGKKTKYIKKDEPIQGNSFEELSEFCQFFTHQEQIARLHSMGVSWESIVKLYRAGNGVFSEVVYILFQFRQDYGDDIVCVKDLNFQSLKHLYDLIVVFKDGLERLLEYGCDVCKITSWTEKKLKLLANERVAGILNDENEFDDIEACYDEDSDITGDMIYRDSLPYKKFKDIFDSLLTEKKRVEKSGEEFDVQECLDAKEQEEEKDGCPEGHSAGQSEDEDQGLDDPRVDVDGELSSNGSSRCSSRCSSFE